MFFRPILQKLQTHPKRIVFPEGQDPRILQAARQFATWKLGVPVLLGDRIKIKSLAEELGIGLEGIRILQPEFSSEFDLLTSRFEGLRRFRGMAATQSREALKMPNYFATMMLATNMVDGIVAGATATASSALRPILQVIPLQKHIRTASSLCMFDLSENDMIQRNYLFLADCGIVPDPTAEQIGEIAATTAAFAHHLTNITPRVALLSYTTKNASSKNPGVLKMRSGVYHAREKAKLLGIPMEVDGDLQVDTALSEAVASSKNVISSVAGKANVLIFPDLHSGNISSKLLQVLTPNRSVGQIITGLVKPAAEISRGASVHDIFNTAVVVAYRAIDRSLLYESEDEQYG